MIPVSSPGGVKLDRRESNETGMWSKPVIRLDSYYSSCCSPSYKVVKLSTAFTFEEILSLSNKISKFVDLITYCSAFHFLQFCCK